MFFSTTETFAFCMYFLSICWVLVPVVVSKRKRNCAEEENLKEKVGEGYPNGHREALSVTGRKGMAFSDTWQNLQPRTSARSPFDMARIQSSGQALSWTTTAIETAIGGAGFRDSRV